jgi:hypothetical protein
VASTKSHDETRQKREEFMIPQRIVGQHSKGSSPLAGEEEQNSSSPEILKKKSGQPPFTIDEIRRLKGLDRKIAETELATWREEQRRLDKVVYDREKKRDYTRRNPELNKVRSKAWRWKQKKEKVK